MLVTSTILSHKFERQISNTYNLGRKNKVDSKIMKLGVFWPFLDSVWNSFCSFLHAPPPMNNENSPYTPCISDNSLHPSPLK